MINRERLMDTFRFLVRIDSVSRQEGDIAEELKKILDSMGAETVFDGAGKMTGSNTGNLIAKFKGNINVPPLLLNAHMDTVEPGRGVVPVLKDMEKALESQNKLLAQLRKGQDSSNQKGFKEDMVFQKKIIDDTFEKSGYLY